MHLISFLQRGWGWSFLTDTTFPVTVNSTKCTLTFPHTAGKQHLTTSLEYLWWNQDMSSEFSSLVMSIV